MASRKIKIAVVQLYSKPLDVAGNFARAESFVRRAASGGADLVVLPEYHLQAWVADHALLVPAARQWRLYLDKYCSLASELGVAIVPGTILEDIPAGMEESFGSARGEGDEAQHQQQHHQRQQIANAAYFIGADGVIRGRYQKKNLWHPERPVLAADARTPHEVFEYEPWGVKIGMLICWDLAFPEGMRELVARGGAQMVICPTCWYDGDNGEEGDQVNPESEEVFLGSLVVARAFENTCGVVLCNAGGPPAATTAAEEDGPDGVKYLGLSQVAMPLVGAMGRLGKEEGMSVVEVDLDVLRIAEEAYKVRADMARKGWHYAHTLRDARA